MIFSSIKNGVVQIWSNKRMIVIFYAINLLFGLILMLPVRAVLKDFAGHSLTGNMLAGRLNIDFLFDFFKHNNEVGSFFGGLLIVAAFYWLLGLFLSGGAFSVFLSQQGYSARQFWGDSGKYFGRFFRLVLWGLPVIAVIFCLQFLESGIRRLIFGSDPYENILYWGNWIRFGLRTISLLLIGIILDYARIHLVATDERKTRRSLVHGIRFAFANPGRTFGLALVLFLAGVSVLALYNPVANALAAPNAFVILLLFVVQQIYMIFRMTLRLTTYASEVDLYRNLIPQEQPEPDVSRDLGIEGAV